MAPEQWVQVLARKKEALSKAKIVMPDETKDFETFQLFLSRLCIDFASRGVAKFVSQMLAPSFDHIRSFAQAINAATQSINYAPFIWAGLQVVLECACRFAESLNEIFRSLEQLHALLPHFQAYIDLYEDENTLKDALGLIYEDYLDFCIHLIKFFSRGPSKNIIRNLFTSSHRKDLKRISDTITDHKHHFEATATLVARRKTVHDHAQILAKVASSPSPATKVVYPIYDIQYRRNPKFLGREETIELLHSQLERFDNTSEPSSSVLHGMGGVGKTQTALEYTYRFSSKYQCIFWLPAEDSIALSRAYCSIGRQVGLFAVGHEHETGQREIEAVNYWLRTTDTQWLLVLDNVEDWESIAVYWPTSCNCNGSIIVTCQKPAELIPWASCDIPITHFDESVGAQFLLACLGIKNSDRTQEEDAQAISKLVGGLPVFLTHISGHIRQSQSSLDEYLDAFQRSSSVWRGRHGGTNWMYERSIETVFDVALSKLLPGARHLIYVMAFLNPDGVPEKILFPDDLDSGLTYLKCAEEQGVSDITADLRNRQLVKRERLVDGAIFTIHRSLQEGILTKLNQEPVERGEVFDCALKALRRLVPRPSLLIKAEPEKWYKMEAYLPQLLSLRRAFARSHPPITGTFEFAELLFDVGMNMWDRGLTRDGQDVLRTAEEVLDAIEYPVVTPARANIHIIIALISDDIGISGRAEALERRKKALDIRQALWDNKSAEEKTPEDEILLYAALGDLSGSYRQINEFDEVRRHCAKLYAKYTEWGDTDTIPYEFAKYYNDMSFERAYCEDTTKAVEYARRAWTLMAMKDPTALLSNQYKLTWTIRLHQDGQHQLAIRECLGIFAFRAKTVGLNNYLTLQSHLTLGILHFYDKNFSEAERCIRQVLEPGTRTVLPEETITRAQYYLSRVLHSKPNSNLLEASQLRTKAQIAMKRLIKSSPWTCDVATVEEPIVYDYLVAAGLRISIMNAEPEKPKKTSSILSRYSRFLGKGVYTLGTSRSLGNLALSNVNGGRSVSTESVAHTLPDILPDLETR